MPADRFLDTNILLYAYDLSAGQKRETAKAILAQAWKQPASTAISVQVLQEFFVNFTKSGDHPEDAHTVISDLTLLPVVDNTLELFGHGLTLRDRWQLSLWDAMILAAAHVSGATQLITEDLNHGQDYGGVKAFNPFR